MPLAERRWSEGRAQLTRSQRSIAPVEVQALPEPPFRLRYVLLVGLIAAALVWVFPRGHGAWKLHNLGTKLADHALCMVGPTGPRLLKDEPQALGELLRRRVVLAPPDARPFLACADQADQLAMSVHARQAYARTAAEFREHQGSSDSAAAYSVSDFEFGRADFDQIAASAWPFVRGGHLRLLEGTAGAKEALHPLSPAKPGVGRGLPASGYVARATITVGETVVGAFGSGANAKVVVSRDGGRTFVAGGRERASELLDRCLVDPGGPAFSLSRTDAGRHVVLSLDVDGPPTAALLGEAEERLVAISCDGRALVALLEAPAQPNHASVRLRHCALRQACRDVAPPPGLVLAAAELDVARVSGDTILVAARGGITRVASTRDDGATWTPIIVAFDAISAELPAQAAPARLLTAGERVLLYGPAQRKSGQYALLASADHGASFRPL